MTNIFLYEDILSEISKHLIHINFTNFSLVNKLCNYTINNLINIVDEYEFLRLNDITIRNKNFVGNLSVPISLNNIPDVNDFFFKYKKGKRYIVKYIGFGEFIKIYSNGYLVINNCISLFDAYAKINNLMILLQNLNVMINIPKIKLISKLSHITFRYSSDLHHNIKYIHKNHYKLTNNTSHFQIYYINTWGDSKNYKINIIYNNFRDFYKCFVLHIKL